MIICNFDKKISILINSIELEALEINTDKKKKRMKIVSSKYSSTICFFQNI